MIKFLPCIVLIFCFSLIGCGPEIVFEKSFEVSEAAWKYNDQARFQFDAPDLNRKYNLLLTVDHSTDFEYQNTYVKISTVFPSGKKNEQSLSLNFADKMGNWMGQCAGENCRATIALQMNTKFEEAGNYKIEVKQDSRENPLQGIRALTFQIEAVEKS